MQTLKEYQAAFSSHLRNPYQQSKPALTNTKRIAVYREIVFNNFLAGVITCFPVLLSILGKRRFKKLARHCFTSHHFSSPLFSDIPKALVDFLQTLNLSANALPLFAAQLAHYEWAELYVSRLATHETTLASSVTINQPNDLAETFVQLQPAHMLLSYDYPVHQLSKKHANLQPTLTHLLVFRKPDFKVAFVQLNAATHQLLQRMQSEHATVTHHLQYLAETLLPHLPPAVVQEFGLQTLHTLYLQQAIVIL